jgi:hypothetical protein
MEGGRGDNRMERVMKEALLLLITAILVVSIISLLNDAISIRENLYYKKVDFWKRVIISINQKYGLEGSFEPPRGEDG